MIKKFSLLFLAAMLLVYSACKKTEAPATTRPVDNKAIAAQIAMNLYQSFTGNLGSDNASSGFKTATSFAGKAAGSGVNLLCGFTKDTTYTFSSNTGGLSISGNSVISETFNCNGNTVNGYTMADSTITYRSSATMSEHDDVRQHYVVTALNSSYQLVSVTGNILVDLGSSQGGYNNSTQSSYYLSNVEISTADNGKPDVIQGQANFSSFVVIINPASDTDGYFGGVGGTITFLGNYTAEVSLTNGQVYMVNMLTGVATLQ